MKHILLPTDFSDNAWSAIVYAIKYYRDDTCTFYLLHAKPLNPSSLATLSDVYIKSIRQQSNQQLLELKQQVLNADKNHNHNFKTVIKFMELNTAVDQFILDTKIDLIIMGTKGATNNKALFFGSNTVHLVDHIKTCPILIVPDQYNYKPIDQIVFSTDLNRFFFEKEINTISEFTANNNAVLRVINIQTNKALTEIQKYNLAVLKSGLKRFETHYHSVPNYDKKATIISTFINDLNIDLLVMVNYKHSLIARYLNQPIIKTIGFNPSVPFLILPETKTSIKP